MKTKTTEVFFKDGINLGLTLDCGQAFRWLPRSDGSWQGIVHGREVTARDLGDSKIRFEGIDDNEFADLFADYFDYYRDYNNVLDRVASDKRLASAVSKYGTVRILNQEPWECLVTFIFSACNNIPRIRGMVERFSLLSGTDINGRGAFPTPQQTIVLTDDDLASVRAGFRMPYVINAARAAADGVLDFDDLKNMPLPDAEKQLMSLRGVGKKVADCALLFSLNHTGAFPVDRHIARFVESHYPDGLPAAFKGIEGIAQQYMFIAQREVV